MDRNEVIAKINEFLIDEFEVSEDRIIPEANLMQTLEIDSLDLVDLVVIIEKTFGFKIKGEDFAGIKTFNDFYEFIINKLNIN